ncbi:multi-sensor signal transduction histidine kinase [Solidesulfovibrio fructosivorans JJ]]|uniref:histidine kinase n=1 Tax=Solidesulfovibrio fructosivorans JJ] TaxID=596151 RepID=E1JXD1_SOLFR|nr:ATP-binding protein [Solidesulfovibrio fructosivorans]EFL50908.1 multi-sensor signal transduction histidine kinase [Solidesulfovibrio fructosivorans JJ]]
MKAFFSGSIHKNLTLLVLLVALPAMALGAYTMLESRLHAERDARQSTLNLLRSLTSMQTGIVSEAKLLLTTLGHLPEVEIGYRAACNERFTVLLGEHPELSNIFLTNKAGIVIASGRPAFLGKDLSDRLYFKEAMSTRDFSAGVFNVGRASGLPILVFALPVGDGASRYVGVIGDSFKLHFYHKFLDKLDLPHQARVGLYDRNGLRMLAYPEDKALPLGAPGDPDLWKRIGEAAADEGMLDDRGQDGARILVAYARLRLRPSEPPYATFVVSMDWQDAFREARSRFARSMALLVLVVAVTLLVARHMGRVAVLAGLDSLMDASDRLGKGDLAARASAGSGSLEIRRLAATFNDMAKGLETRAEELRLRDRELARMRNLLNNILESMPSAIIALDEDGLVTHFNGSAQAMCALTPEKALGRPPAEVLPLLSAHLDKLQRALRQRQVQRVEHERLRLDGVERLFDLQFYPLVANGINGAVIRLDDVTERERLREMMIQSEKMASVGGLAAGMAHEINNPLSSILQAAQVCLMQCDPAIEGNRKAAEECECTIEAVHCYIERRRIAKFLEGIRDAGKRAAQIVSSMLEFSRKSESRRAPADINELLEHSLALAATDYDLKKKYDFRHIEIIRDYASDLPEVMCTRTEVEQVLLNLFKNAAQAMAANPDPARKPAITVRTRLRDGHARIEVGDNGPGMEEQVRTRIFEPFFTTKEPGEGTGLGLSVSYFIITTNHGGTIRVDSRPGQGTTFVIELPLGERA